MKAQQGDALTRRALLAGLLLPGCQGKRQRYHGLVFGQAVSLRMEGPRALADEVFAFCRTFEPVFSLWDETSALSRLNREGRLKEAPPALIEVIRRAGELYQRSDGVFDPSIETLLHWIRQRRAAGLDLEGEGEVRKQVDFSQVRIHGRELRLPPGMRLSLNAIVQGWVTDRVCEKFGGRMGKALVNIGEFRVTGGAVFPVEIEGTGKVIFLRQALAVSSGGKGRLSATGGRNHLVHPREATSPAVREIFVVEAREAWLADGLATVAAVTGTLPEGFEGVKFHHF